MSVWTKSTLRYSGALSNSAGIFHAPRGRIRGMSERDEKRGGGAGCAIGCLLVFLLLPVLYMLSIGPVAVLVNHNESLQWMGVIYHPLGWLAESYEPIGDALGWYVELWM